MKDSEFIELLNLYLDHEIGTAEAAKLEAEVQHNPERRRLYRQYCAMQKACTELADRYADVEVPQQKVIRFSPRRQAWYPAALAAAACLTVLLFIRTRETAPVVAPAQPIAVNNVTAPENSFVPVPLKQVSTSQLPTDKYAANADQSLRWLTNTTYSPLNIDLTRPSATPARNTAPLLASPQAPIPSFQSENIETIAFKLQRSN